MTKRRNLSILAATTIGAALAITTVGGAATALADSGEGLRGQATTGAGATSATGYMLEVDDAGNAWLVDAGSEMLSGEHDGEDGESGEHGPESSEGTGESGEASGDSGEESGTQYPIDQLYDEVRAGARLVIGYDLATNAFQGLVENITDQPLSQVRVEVHLSNGTELGPTTPTDLAPGQVLEVVLPATDTPFDTFSAHPEVGSGEAEAGETAGEHGSEGGNGEASEAGHDESGEQGDS